MHDNGQQIASAALELTKNGIEFIFGQLQDYLDLESIKENREFIENMLQKGGDVFMVTNISTVDMDNFRKETGYNYLQGKDDNGRSIFFLPKDSFETFGNWCKTNDITPVVENHEFTAEDAFESAVNQSEDQKRQEARHDFNVHCETCKNYNETVDKLNIIAKSKGEQEAEYRDFFFAADIGDKFVAVVALDGENFVKYSIDNTLDINDLSQGTYQTINKEEAFEIYTEAIDSNYALGHFTHDNICKLLRKDEIEYKYEKEPFTYKKEEQEVSQNNQEKDTTKEQNEASQDIDNPAKQPGQLEQAPGTKNQEDDEFEHDRNDQYNYTDNLENDNDDIDEAENARKWAEYEEQRAKESQDIMDIVDDDTGSHKEKNKKDKEEKRRKEENDRLNKAKEDERKREEQKHYEEIKKEENQRFEQSKKAEEQRIEQVKRDNAKRLEQEKNKESENIIQAVATSEAIKSSETKQVEQSYQETKIQTETKSVESLKAEEAKSAEAEKVVQRLEREAYQREISEAQIRLNEERTPELREREESIRNEAISKEHTSNTYATISGNSAEDTPNVVKSDREYHNAAMDVHEANRTRETRIVENTKAVMNTQEWRDGVVGDGMKNYSKYSSMYDSAFGYNALKASYDKQAVNFRASAMNGNYSELSAFMKEKGYNCDFKNPDSFKQNLTSVKSILRAEGIHDVEAFKKLPNDRLLSLFAGVTSTAQLDALKKQTEAALKLGALSARVDKMGSKKGGFLRKLADDKLGDEAAHQGYKNLKSKADTINMGRKLVHTLKDARHHMRARSLARYRQRYGTGGPRYDRMVRNYNRSSYRYDRRNRSEKLSAESRQYVKEARARRNERINKRADKLNKRKAGAGDKYKQRVDNRKRASRRREAKRRLRKERRRIRNAPFKKFFGGIANKIGKVFRIVSAPFNVVYIVKDYIKTLIMALLKKVIIFLAPYIGIFLLYLLIFSAAVAAITGVLSFISSFDINEWDVNNVYDTPMGITYKNVISLEKSWVKDLKKTGSQNKEFEKYFGDNTTTELNTLASKNSLVTVKDNYIVYDAFGLGIDEYKHEIKKIDGGCNINYINVNNPGYFSNVKDILSMTSVYFGLDTEEYSEEEKKKWYEECVDWLESAANFCNNLSHKLSGIVESAFNWDAPSATNYDYSISAMYDSYALTLFGQTHDVDFHIHSATTLPTCKQTSDFKNGEGFISVCTYAFEGGCAKINIYFDDTGDVYITNGNIRSYFTGDGRDLNELLYWTSEDNCSYLSTSDEQKQNSKCWTPEYTSITIEENSIVSETLTGDSNTFSRRELAEEWGQSKLNSIMNGTQGEGRVINYSIGFNGQFWYVTVIKEITKTSIKQEVSGYTHNCQGHEARYCGGHVMLDASGLIHSIPAEMLVEDTEITEDISRITPNGVTVIGEDGEVKMEKMNNYDSANIFEIDSAIKHRIKPGEWEGWTSDNISIAIMRYDQDWKELYAIDFGDSELGNISFTSVEVDETLRAIEERYGQPIDDTRKAKLKMALSYVGKVGYNQGLHSTLFPENGGTTVISTDCSGYASNVWFDELGCKIRTCAGFYSDYINSGYMQKWDDNIKPGDIFISKGLDDVWGYNSAIGKGDDHALIYAGTDTNGQVWVLECTTDKNCSGVRYGIKSRDRSYFTNSYYIDMSQLY